MSQYRDRVHYSKLDKKKLIGSFIFIIVLNTAANKMSAPNEVMRSDLAIWQK
jgi:hypothetical protein